MPFFSSLNCLSFFEGFDYEMIPAKGRGFFLRTPEEQNHIKKKGLERHELVLKRKKEMMGKMEEAMKINEEKTRKKLAMLKLEDEKKEVPKKKKLVHTESAIVEDKS